jgi:heme oxygenase
MIKIDHVERNSNEEVQRVIVSAGKIELSFAWIETENRFKEVYRANYSGGSSYIPPAEYNAMMKQVYTIFSKNRRVVSIK